MYKRLTNKQANIKHRKLERNTNRFDKESSSYEKTLVKCMELTIVALCCSN